MTQSQLQTHFQLKELVEDSRLNGTDSEFNFYKKMLEKFVLEVYLSNQDK